MVRDEDLFPVDTVVRLRKTGEFARIMKLSFLKDEGPGKQWGFLNYLAEIEGRHGQYAVYHHEIDLEALPPTS